jgi:hypothetical protein
MKAPEAKAKFRIDTLECTECFGFTAKDVKLIKKELKTRQQKMMESWREIHERN